MNSLVLLLRFKGYSSGLTGSIFSMGNLKFISLGLSANRHQSTTLFVHVCVYLCVWEPCLCSLSLTCFFLLLFLFNSEVKFLSTLSTHRRWKAFLVTRPFPSQTRRSPWAEELPYGDLHKPAPLFLAQACLVRVPGFVGNWRPFLSDAIVVKGALPEAGYDKCLEGTGLKVVS